MRTLATEPNYSKPGMSGSLSVALVLREKGWIGHKETKLHIGEGPIW